MFCAFFFFFFYTCLCDSEEFCFWLVLSTLSNRRGGCCQGGVEVSRVSESCGLASLLAAHALRPDGHLDGPICRSRCRAWLSGALCVCHPLPVHFPNVKGTAGFWEHKHFALSTWGIKGLTQAMRLHFDAAGSTHTTDRHCQSEVSFQVMVWKSPFKLFRK